MNYANLSNIFNPFQIILIQYVSWVAVLYETITVPKVSAIGWPKGSDMSQLYMVTVVQVYWSELEADR